MTEITPKAKIIFIIALLCAFALASAALAFLGVHVYKIAGDNSDTNTITSASEYFTAQIRQCTDKTKIRTATAGGEISALVIPNTDSGQDEETWIYAYEGSLKEATLHEGEELTPGNGTDVLNLKSTDFEITDGNLLQISMTLDSGTQYTLNINLAGGDGSE